MELPSWIKIKPYNKKKYQKTLDIIRSGKLNTVCLEADCPNRYECFTRSAATFMILGDICTRNCDYCNIKKGRPRVVDESEPERIAVAIKKLNLNYAVITCVSRDDLADGGASQFVRTIRAIKKSQPTCKVEVLISDLQGNWTALKKIINAKPDLINHNLEAVREIFSLVRPQGDYKLSLNLLQKTKELAPEMIVKSGFMLGLGETESQIKKTLKDLKKSGCDIVTIGQYLQPSRLGFKVKKYYQPSEFKKIEIFGKKIGLKNILAGSLVRSSYKADSCF